MIYGYSDRLSVAPEETIEFKLSCSDGDSYSAELVRLINGDTNPAGPGKQFRNVASSITGEYPSRVQSISRGSWAEPDATLPVILGASGGLHAFVFPTLPDAGTQTIMSCYDRPSSSGWWLGLRNGLLSLRLGDAESDSLVEASEPLMKSVWYSVTASWSAGTAYVSAIPVINSYNSIVSAINDVPRILAEGDIVTPEQPERLLIGASSAGNETEWHFNGKLEGPKLFRTPLSREDTDRLAAGRKAFAVLGAHWDFSADIGAHDVATDRITDVGPFGLHGKCYNQPLRAVTGRLWGGRQEVYWQCPSEYGAIKFNSDDLDDACWETDISFDVPGGLTSGVYALHAKTAGAETFIPFWVLPPRKSASAKVLLLFPTATYMAYANQDDVTASGGQAVAGHTPVVDLPFVDLMRNPGLGRSLYDPHADGTGISFTSRRRPIITMRPDVRHGTGEVWCLAADLQIVSWLETIGVDFDVATDEDLHEQGSDLLSRYNVVLTGTHPEYCSERMLDGWEEYLHSGGRAMYLGGNGFYWVIGFHPKKPHLIELRRGEAGARAWQSEPGELYLQTTGERSGTWRNRNRAPNKLFGVGTTSIGFDRSGFYTPLTDWADPEVGFITKGCESVECVGRFGLVGGGAAGSEMDRYDLSLGTPPSAFVLASSVGTHSANYSIVPEDAPFIVDGMGGDDDARVRADLVYFTTRNGGAVFSASSIAWCSALSHNDYNNEVQTLTSNVLRAFAADADIPSSGFSQTDKPFP